MGQINSVAYSPRLTVEIITASGTWTPPRPNMTVFVEPCGAGQSGGNSAPGESGDLGYGIFRGVTGPLTIVIGQPGTPPSASSSAPVSGGDTTVAYGGMTYTGLGGGKGGKRTGKPGGQASYNSSTGNGQAATEGISVQSLILGLPSQRSPGALNAGGANTPAAGAPSPLASGGASTSSAGLPGTLGAGGGVAIGGSNPAGAGGPGFVLIGYYEALT